MSVYRNKGALVTGDASGIGQALAVQLAAQGARVVQVDVNVDGLQETVESIAQQGGQAQWRKLDVTDRAAVQAVVEEVYATEGPLDYLFNNAGVCLFGVAHQRSRALPLSPFSRRSLPIRRSRCLSGRSSTRPMLKHAWRRPSAAGCLAPSGRGPTAWTPARSTHGD